MSGVVASARRIVVKVGSTLLTNDGRGLDHAAVARWAGEIARLRATGKEHIPVPDSQPSQRLPDREDVGVDRRVVLRKAQE